MQTVNNHPRPIQPRRGPVLLGLTFVIIAGWVGVALFLHRQGLPPHVTIPATTFPLHNAYDDFEGAYKLLRNRDEVECALDPTHEHIIPADHVYTPAQISAIVRDNRAALRAVDQGLHHPFLQPAARSFAAMGANDSGLHYRQLARLLCLTSSVLAARGDWSGAVNHDLDCMETGAQITHGGDTLAFITGEAVQSLGGRELQKDLIHLSDGQACNALYRLQSIISRGAPLDEVVKEEEWRMQAILLNSMRSPHWRSFDRSDGESLADCVIGWVEVERWSNQQIMDGYTGYMNSLVALYGKPYPIRKRLPPPPENPYSNMFVGVASSLSFSAARSCTGDNLLIGNLALRAYYCDHHSFPNRLQELVPAYLPTVPVDPFTVNAPLRYHRTDAGYVLYSVGPDGNDDGARPIPTKNPDGSRATFDDNSKGDIGTIRTRDGLKDIRV